jgi:hypothetical protein
MLTKRNDDNLNARGQTGYYKPCLMITDSGLSVTTAKLHIIAYMSKRNMSQKYVLQRVSSETLPVLKGATVELPLAHTALQITVFIGKITNESILGLDMLQAYDTAVELKHSVLRLCKEEPSLWLPGGTSISLYDHQQQGNTSSMCDSCDCTVSGPPGGSATAQWDQI